MKDNKIINKVNKRLVIVFLLLIISIASGTFAWFTFRSNKTTLTLTVGDYDETKVTVSPYQINTTLGPSATYYLDSQGDGVFTKIKAVNTNKYSKVEMRLYYKINELDTSLDLTKLKYTIVRSDNDTDGSHWIDENINDNLGAAIYTGDFSTITDGEIIFSEMIPEATSEGNTVIYYRIYLWIDGSNGNSIEYENKILDVELNGELKTNGTIPVLDDGMIPVKIADNGKVTTTSPNDPNWYNYNEKEWANIVLVRDSRSDYKNSFGIQVDLEDILAYYVWIPRYRYRVWTDSNSSDANKQEIEISFGHTPELSSYSTTTTIGNWRSHPAFWWDNNSNSSINEGELVSGIWVGKFETGLLVETVSEDPLTINTTTAVLPGIQSDSGIVSTYIQKSKEFIKFGNEYGLDSNNTNSHVIKNSEWGSVAYLTNSEYGLNDNLRINNYYNSRTMTGCGASTDNGATAATCQIPYPKFVSDVEPGDGGGDNGTSSDGGGTSGASLGGDDVSVLSSDDDNLFPQSTTGNITGIFDMSGGAWDFVMGNFNDFTKNSGLSSMPASKYYDKYTGSTWETSCNSTICYGHAMSETRGWYGDYYYAAKEATPWYMRGCGYMDETDAGIYCAKGQDGDDGNTTWRSVLIAGVSSDVVVDVSIGYVKNELVSAQGLSIKWNADLGIVGYYIGIENPETKNVTWTEVPSPGDTNYSSFVDSNGYMTRGLLVRNPGMYYFALKNQAGDIYVLSERFIQIRLDGNYYIIRAGDSITLPSASVGSNQTFQYWYVTVDSIDYPVGKVGDIYDPTTLGGNIKALITGNNSLSISYYVDGGTIAETTEKDGHTYNWSTANDGLVLLNGETYQDFYSLDSTNINLRKVRDSEFMNITKWASAAVPTEEWVCYEGCSVANKVFNVNATYTVSDFCSDTSSSCNVKLKVNWEFTGEDLNRYMYRVYNKRLAIYYVTTCDNETESCKYTSKYGITGSWSSSKRYEYVRDNVFGTSTYNNKGVGEIARELLTTDYMTGVTKKTWYVNGSRDCRKHPEAMNELDGYTYKSFKSGCAGVTMYLIGMQRLASSNALEEIYWVPAGNSNPGSIGDITTGKAASSGYYGCYIRRTHVYGNNSCS